MSEYKLKDGNDMDSIGLELYLKDIENPPLSPSTQSLSNTYNTRTGIRLLFIAGVLAISNLGNDLERNHVKLKSSTFSAESVADYNRTVEKPFDDYIDKLSSLVIHKGCYTKNYVLDNIIAYRALNENWDGYGALPLQIKCASNTIQFINSLSGRVIEKIRDFHPNPNGTFSLVWENEVGERLALELGNNTLSYYVKFNSQDPMFFNDIENNDKEVNRISDFVKAL